MAISKNIKDQDDSHNNLAVRFENKWKWNVFVWITSKSILLSGDFTYIFAIQEGPNLFISVSPYI